MSENQKDSMVMANQSDQQNQVKNNNDDKQQKSGSADQKAPTTISAAEPAKVGVGKEKEHQDKEHQHEFKAPVGDQNRMNESQDKNQTQKSESDVTKNQGSKPVAEQKG